MSNLADSDEGRQQQLGNSGEYNPTGRAAAGARAAKAAGAGSHPVVSDGPSSADKPEEARKGTGENPTSHAGKKAPGVDAAYKNSEDPSLSTRSFSERSA